MKSILDIEVSCFASYKAASHPRPVNLLTWLNSSQYRTKVETIRATTDKKARDREKATLPAITPSGLFTRRHDTALIQHSGFVCLDIDLKGNEAISNYTDLKREICQIKNVAYCGLSVSGTGFFILIPITCPEHHREHFNALRELFQKRYTVRVDNTPDVSRLRGYSYDLEGYFNHNAISFSGLYTPTPTIRQTGEKTEVSYKFKPDDSSEIILQRCVRLIEEAQDGQKHTQLNRAAYLAGGLVASGLVDEVEAVNALENAINQKSNVSDWQAAYRTIRDGIRDGKKQPILLPETETSTFSHANSHSFSQRIENSERVSTTNSLVQIQPDRNPGAEAASTSFYLPQSLEVKWQMFDRPPFWWNKIATDIALLNCLEVNEHTPNPPAYYEYEEVLGELVPVYDPEPTLIERLRIKKAGFPCPSEWRL